MNKISPWTNRSTFSVVQTFIRSIHYKENSKKYPKVNIENVQLETQKVGFRKERAPLISQTVLDTLFPSTKIRRRYLQEGKPVPIKYRSFSDEIAKRNFEKYQDEVAEGRPHFKVGETKIYFPKARICLLRPNAKHTPYQAKFLVPRNFNKMDLRDYLWHVYGLRALNVTVQLLHSKWQRGPEDYARHRGPQFKKMTVDMEEPFVWPEISDSMAEKYKAIRADQFDTIQYKNYTGSDKLKHPDVFDGLYKKPELPNSFIPRRSRTEGAKVVELHKKHMDRQTDKELLSNYLNL